MKLYAPNPNADQDRQTLHGHAVNSVRRQMAIAMLGVLTICLFVLASLPDACVVTPAVVGDLSR